jgi:hypothetical protein
MDAAVWTTRGLPQKRKMAIEQEIFDFVVTQV